MKTNILFSIFCLFVCNFYSISQVNYIDKETTHQISNKAERGYLGSVETNDAAKELKLYFVTKVKSKKIKVETYVFDYDLNFISSFKEEFENGKDVKSKFKWFNFRNSDYETYYGVTADPNLTGTLVFRKKQITTYFNWFSGSYKTSIKNLDKLKPKGDDGKKYRYVTHFDNNQTGEVLAIVTPKDNKDINRMNTAYSIMRVDADLNIKSNEAIPFKNSQYLIYAGAIQNEEYAADGLYEGDYVMIFAPMENGGGVKNADENGANYTYVRITQDGKVREMINYNTKATKWRIEGVYEAGGAVFAYGPGKKMKSADDAYGSYKTYDPAKMEKGFDNFQLVSFKDNKVQFINAPNIDEMEGKTVAPAGQKKIQEYNGGRIKVTGITACKNGDVLVQAQMAIINFVSKETVYKDFLVFHFKKDGELKTLFSIDSPAKSGLAAATDPLASPAAYTSQTQIIQSNDENYAYWLTGLVTKVDVVESSDYAYFGYTEVTRTYTPREQLIMARVNLKDGTMEEVQTVGDGQKGKKDFFLLPTNRYTVFNGGKSLLILGEDRSSFSLFGKNNNFIYLGALNFSKL